VSGVPKAAALAALPLVVSVACAQPHPSALKRSAPTPSPAVVGAPAPTHAATATPVGVNIAVGGTQAASTAELIAGCQRTPAGYGVQLQMTVDRTPYVLSIEIIDYHGPAAYSVPPERVSLRPSAPGGTPYLEPATSGIVKIDSGERSGTADVTLQGARSTRLHGTWACG
jgi:hypothetical protein